jgi:nucleotide-binding universal stress UspA family protein
MSTAPMSTAASKSVVVGLDQSAGARAALEWAAAEARLRGVPLRIATSWNGLDHDLPKEYQPGIAEPVHRAAAAFLDEAAAALRANSPGLDIDTVLMAEAPAEGLIRLAQDAGLLVIGRRGLNLFLKMLLGSVSQRVVAHAPVPVVVVPESPHPAADRAPVVVGVAREVTEPLAFAFAEAKARQVPLVALRAWTISNPYVAA